VEERFEEGSLWVRELVVAQYFNDGHGRHGGRMRRDQCSKVSAVRLRGVYDDIAIEQQRHGLDLLKASDAERKAKIDIQERIQTAVVSGVGWEGLPPEYRKAADTPWFRSLLQYDPAPIMKRIKQPVLLVMGGKSHEVSPVWQQRQSLLTAWLGNAEPFVLDGATHMLHLQNTRGMAERLARFVADHPLDR
jgi:pimeloyl-ACP methyl ester carboxylesterase